eukprot:CAMPEP_0119555106 /NCGR_PEP_ID=MMETSP1352-20130426/7422_1 /TAXON_ID=265584 /ORGANISM="Stauroneis constricta, Strain CCMP1120" /LENGTH=480 /DNA_ID=CAMNT_0007601819 /DNA_START=61 /DNA_END=1503 /DNA_ORIENTATION=-
MISMRKFLSGILAVAALAGQTSVAHGQQTIVEIAQGDPDTFSTLLTAVGVADESVGTALQGEGPLTVFAPTNQAFANLPNGALQYLLDNPDVLTTVLFYHVLTTGEVFSDQISNGQTATTASGEDVSFRFWWSFSWRHWRWTKNLFVNDAFVSSPDIDASNGVVHVIDTVLIPPSVTIPLDIVDTAARAGEFNVLLAALQITGLDTALASPNGPYTVFAPTDQAFIDLPPGVLHFLLKNENQGTLADILAYHVLNGEADKAAIEGGVSSSATLLDGASLSFAIVNDDVVINTDAATVTTPDVDASNGIIHIIDSVLLPPDLDLPKDIVGVADDAGSFTTLLSALDAAGLTETLQGEGRFTVFAPTDAAFEKIPEEDLQALLADPTGELADILKYHVLFGEYTAEDLVALDGRSISTSNFKSLDVAVVDGKVVLNEQSTVETEDIIAVNGIIHVIDEVLSLPEDNAQCPAWLAWLCSLFGW